MAKKKRIEPRLFIDIDTEISLNGLPGITSIREFCRGFVNNPVESEYVEAIPIEWLESTLTKMICSGKLKSSDAAVVYTLIHEWRKTYER